MNYENHTKSKYEFSFTGGANLESDGEIENDSDFRYIKKENDYRSKNAVLLLNSKKEEIADKINNVLERQLPSSYSGNVKIVTSLEFGQGSITWMGIITVLDWFGRIVDTVTFIQLMSSAIQFAVKKVISKETARNSITIEQKTIYINVTPNFAPESQADILYRDVILRQNEQLQILREVSRNLENLLNYIGQLREKNSAFRLSSYSTKSEQQPRRFSRDTLILLSLLLLGILQIINYFGMDSINGWFTRLTQTLP